MINPSSPSLYPPNTYSPAPKEGRSWYDSSKSTHAATDRFKVFNLDTYDRRAVIEAHRGSVLGLCLSQDQTLLFSTATDPILNVWSTQTFIRLYALYSTYDVGDIFCVAYSSYHQIVYLGAQNTSIQWYDLKEKDTRPRPEPTAHPSHRQDRFFDSAGPGGVRTPRPYAPEDGPRSATGGQVLEIDKQYIRQFAHYGYVYCMLLGKGILPNHPTEEVLVSGGGDGLIRVWRIEPNVGGAITELYTLEDGREEGESILSLAREGSFLYSGRLDGEVNVWDLETKQLVRSLKTRTGDVLTMSIGGGFLFTGGVTGIIEKFNRHYESVSTFKAHDGLILASAFTMHNDKPIFVTGGNDHTIDIWDVGVCGAPSGTSSRTNNGENERLVLRFLLIHIHSRPHGGNVEAIHRISHGVIATEIPCRMQTGCFFPSVNLQELRCCH